jgi:hypothetical protein
MYLPPFGLRQLQLPLSGQVKVLVVATCGSTGLVTIKRLMICPKSGN